MKLQRLFLHNAWSIGVLEHRGEPDELLRGKLPPVRWILHPKGDRWWADPFLLEHEDQRYLLCEEMNVRRNRGHIACVALDSDPPSLSIALQRPYHLSYPYVIPLQGRTYVVPEMSEARKVTLFEAHGHPPQLKEVAVLIDDFAAVDPTPVQVGDRWWLFCTNAEEGDNTALYLWFADALHGPWQPHPANPVKRDIRSARPAGTPFLRNGELFRPAQDCSREYGGRIVLNRVTTLDRKTFREEPVAWLDPDPYGPCPRGLHTLCLGDTLTVVDGKSVRFSKFEMLRTAQRAWVARRKAG